jgi:hypothetical protein
MNGFTDRLKRAIDHGKGTGRVRLDADARDYWNNAVYAPLTADYPGLLGVLTARAEAHVQRLALIYCLLDRAPAISRTHIDAALAVWAYCVDSTRWAFGDRLGNRTAEAIRQYLLAHPNGVTRTMIRDLFGRNKAAHEIAEALALLIDNGVARYEMRPPSSGVGKPVEWWFPI